MPGLRTALLALLALPLVGCPHLIFAVPTLLNDEPRFRGPAGAAPASPLVPIRVDLETGGHFAQFYLRVDGQNLSPSAGPCRRWFMRRGAREFGDAPRSFCDDDAVRFRIAAGVPHRIELLVGSVHTVAKRVYLEYSDNLRWQMPISSQPVELSFVPEPGSSYTIRAREIGLDLRRALGENAPRGTDWDPDAHSPSYLGGSEVGSLELEVMRNADRRIVGSVSAPLYSGPLACGPPFCVLP